MQEILDRWYAVQMQNPKWRSGQALFNALLEVRPELAEQIRATIMDPFYQDFRIPKVLIWLERTFALPN